LPQKSIMFFFGTPFEPPLAKITATTFIYNIYQLMI
jgi:hypothetical protein